MAEEIVSVHPKTPFCMLRNSWKTNKSKITNLVIYHVFTKMTKWWWWERKGTQSEQKDEFDLLNIYHFCYFLVTFRQFGEGEPFVSVLPLCCSLCFMYSRASESASSWLKSRLIKSEIRMIFFTFDKKVKHIRWAFCPIKTWIQSQNSWSVPKKPQLRLQVINLI